MKVPVPLETLEAVWRKVEKDADGSRALKSLYDAGFTPRPLEVAVIPFLPARRARSRSISVPGSGRLVSRFLREVGDAVAESHCAVEARDRSGVIHAGPGVARKFPNLHELADSLDQVLRCKWAVTWHNQRQNAVARLQWEARQHVRERTGNPDAHVPPEIAHLLGAVFRIAGKKMGVRRKSLKRVLAHETATRKAGRKKLPR